MLRKLGTAVNESSSSQQQANNNRDFNKVYDYIARIVELCESFEQMQYTFQTPKKQLLSANDVVILQSHLQHLPIVSSLENHYLSSNSSAVMGSNNTQLQFAHNSLYISTRNHQTMKTLLDLNILSESTSIECIGPILDNILELLSCTSTTNMSIGGQQQQQQGADAQQQDMRHVASTLLLRYLEFNPSAHHRIIPVFLQCISHPSLIVRRNAIKFALQVYPYCFDRKKELLERLFLEGDEAMDAINRIITLSIKS